MFKRAVLHIAERWEALSRPVLFAFAALYLLNCCSPLRLEYDSIKYFALKDCLEQGCPPGFNPVADPHPYGYALLLLLLSKLGLLHSFVLVLINGLYLAYSLYFIKKIFRASVPPFLFLLLLLLNWTVIKYFSYPLSEMQYLFFSCGSFFFFKRYAQHRKMGALLLAFAFAGGSFITRTAGITLFPALLAGLAWEHREELNRHRWRYGLLTLTGILFLLAGILFFPNALHFTNYLNSLHQKGPGIGYILSGHFKEWGQLLLNTPAGKVAAWLPGTDSWLFIPAGFLLFAWFAYGLFLRRTTVPVVITIYLVSYCLVIFNWPFFDPRFWIPILPMVAAILLQRFPAVAGPVWFPPVAGPVRFLKRTLLILYILTGLGAMGYSTYTAFHKETLARSQAKGIFRNEYETFFFGRPVSDTATHVNPYVLHILEKYN